MFNFAYPWSTMQTPNSVQSYLHSSVLTSNSKSLKWFFQLLPSLLVLSFLWQNWSKDDKFGNSLVKTPKSVHPYPPHFFLSTNGNSLNRYFSISSLFPYSSFSSFKIGKNMTNLTFLWWKLQILYNHIPHTSVCLQMATPWNELFNFFPFLLALSFLLWMNFR